MWWTNRFGSISGPYTDEQIVRLVQTNRLTRLCKISSDRAAWMRLDQSEFWAGRLSVPEEIELPSATLPKLRMGAAGKHMERGGENDFPVQSVPQETGYGDQVLRETPPGGGRKTSSAGVLTKAGILPRWVVVAVVSCVAIAIAIIAVVAVVAIRHNSRGNRDVEAGGKIEETTPANTETGCGEATKGGQDRGGGVSFESIKRKVAIIQTSEGVGTGFFLRMGDKVYLVTNEHVIRGSGSPTATLIDGENVSLGEFSIAEDRDIARYEVKGGYEYFVLADGSPNNDDPIWVFGNSSGDGVVTTLKGHVTGVGGMILKVDADFVGGNSGSPIVNDSGKVVGIATYALNGGDGKDWKKRDTEFDKVRRFGLRFTDVRWLPVDKLAFANECGSMAAFETFYELLLPYLRCLDVSDEEFSQLKLVQKEIDRKRFGNYDAGFHDMLMELSKSLNGSDKSWTGWASVMDKRDAVIKQLNSDIENGELAYDNAVAALDEFDRKNDIIKKWEKVKERNRDFIAKRKEALLMARFFLTKRDWHDPCIKHGYVYDKWNCVDGYLDIIEYWLDQNEQKLKDVNAALKRLEKGDEDED